MTFAFRLPGRTPGRHSLSVVADSAGCHSESLYLARDLLAGDLPPVTGPARGAPFDPACECPIDQCPWPEVEYEGVDRHTRLLEHLRMHSSDDVNETIRRLQRAVNRLQNETS